MRTYKVEGDDLVESDVPAVVLSRQARMIKAEAAFDAHYAHGGMGQADDVWRHIATRYGALGVLAPIDPTPFREAARLAVVRKDAQ